MSLCRECADTVELPAHHLEAIDRKAAIQDATPVDVFVSSMNPAWAWRWKLVSYYRARKSGAETAETVIVDSGVNRWGSPDDVLQAASKVNADYVIATDVTGFEDHSNDSHNPAMPSADDPGIETQEDAAIEGVNRFMKGADDLNCEYKIILPIQPPYLDFLDRVADRGWLNRVAYIAVGGLLGIDDAEDRIGMLGAVRERVGNQMKIHALAPGTELAMIRHLRDHPNLLTSLDISTPELAIAKDKLPDASWTQQSHPLPRGQQVSTLRGSYSEAIALQLAFMLSPLCNERTFEEVAEDAGAHDGEQQSLIKWLSDADDDQSSQSAEQWGETETGDTSTATGDD